MRFIENSRNPHHKPYSIDRLNGAESMTNNMAVDTAAAVESAGCALDNLRD